MNLRRFIQELTLPDKIAGFVLLTFLILGIAIYSSYGLSWDEPTQLQLGIQNFRYIIKGDPSLLSNKDRWYGPLFEIFLVAAQSRGSLDRIFLSRHLLNFLAFFIGCIAFFLLVKKFTRNGWLGLIGVICLIISPRIFADAFYNSKDIPFLTAYTICLLSLLWFVEKPTPSRAALHGLFTAVLLSIRLPGLIIPVLTILGLAIEMLAKRGTWKRVAISFTVYLATTLAFTVIFWPALWKNPASGFLEAFAFMSRFPHNSEMLYLGKLISDSSPPWHYVLVWIGITTPILYLIGFLTGLIAIIVRGLKAFQNFPDRINPDRRNDLLIVCAFLGPVIVVIGLQSSLYSGWRQMYFLYTPFLLVMLTGFKVFFDWLLAHTRQQLAVTISVILLILGILPTTAWMIQHHPYQNVYFNRLAGADMKTIQQRFPLDYWGLAYQRGIQAIQATDDREKINIFVESQQQALGLLTPAEANRIFLTDDLREADYFLGNYRDISRVPYPFSNEVFSVQIGNAKILSVFKLSPQERQ
jgi:hypothetical protein